MSQIKLDDSASYSDAIARAADECGVFSEYWDIFHKKHEAGEDIRRAILHALGWDVSSQAAIDRERRGRFHQDVTAVLPRTAVLSESDKSVPLTHVAGISGSVCFELALEDGQQLAGSLELSQLPALHGVQAGDDRWVVRVLPLPAETPLGYHRLKLTVNGQSSGENNVIVCPDRAYLPERLHDGGRTAGFNVSLYGLRSDRNWGCGDFTDLRSLVDWARNECGFSFIGVNPLHALHNRVPYNTSPYLPLSIFYKNLLYIDIEALPEFQSSTCAQQLFHSDRVQQRIASFRAAEFVRYHDIDQLKRRFLKLLYRDFRRHRSANQERWNAFVAYCEREGDLLDKFALYCALDEVLHKQDRNRWTWQHWPAEYQSPDSEASRVFAREHARTVEFYKYIQFVLEEQLSAAQQYAKRSGMPIGLYHDLAVATDSCGSDLWAHREFFVSGCRVGSPPDDFSPKGQDWAFPPPNSDMHRQTGYRLYRESIRKIVKNGGALRIDHVMRLFRLFWIPEGVEATRGTYVKDRATDLMRILALESVRSKNIIVGEDLGTVTDEIRDTLSRFAILSYRLFYFEKDRHTDAFIPSRNYPRQALVASSTHDLPTIAGFWTGRDIEARRAAGLADEHGYQGQKADRHREKQRMLDALHAENLLPSWYPRDAAQVPEVDGPLHNAVIGFLAGTPSMILLLNQEDFTKETEQQNLPGSTSEYPNWQRKMKVKIEDLRSSDYQPYAEMIRHQLTNSGRIA